MPPLLTSSYGLPTIISLYGGTVELLSKSFAFLQRCYLLFSDKYDFNCVRYIMYLSLQNLILYMSMMLKESPWTIDLCFY